MHRLLILFALHSLLIGCNMGSSNSGPQYDLRGYTTTDLGSGAIAADFFDQTGKKLSSGFTLGGVRNGLWSNYHDGNSKLRTLTNYINGKKNGTEIQLNDRGSVTSITTYQNDILHGLSVTYNNNGRVVSETYYANGVLHGPFKEYDDRGNLQRSGEMKNGKKDGSFIYYLPDGTESIRYVYKDDVKVSGGIVDEE